MRVLKTALLLCILTLLPSATVAAAVGSPRAGITVDEAPSWPPIGWPWPVGADAPL